MSTSTATASASFRFARRRDHPYFIGGLPERIYCQESSPVYEGIELTFTLGCDFVDPVTRSQDRARRPAYPVAPWVTAAECALRPPLLIFTSSFSRIANKQPLPKKLIRIIQHV